jgi:hypothetical protein
MNCQSDRTYYCTIIGVSIFHNIFFNEYNKIWTSFHSMKRMKVSELGGYIKFKSRCTYTMYESSGFGKYFNLTRMVNLLYRVERICFRQGGFSVIYEYFGNQLILIICMDSESDVHDHQIINMYTQYG